MTTELQKKMTTIRDLLKRSEGQIRAALPKFLTVERMTRIFLTTIQKTPKLLECDQKSLIGAFMQSASLGLECDGILGQAYIIPYGNKANFQIGYKGLLALARRSNEITSFNAQVVYEKDLFEFEYGLHEKLKHVPCMTGERGKLKAAYAVARFKDGGYAFDVMFGSDIEKVRKSSKAQSTKDSPWNTWEEEMWRKTVAKRLTKYLPQAIETQRASQIDERIDMQLDEDIIEVQTGDIKTGLKIAETPKEDQVPQEAQTAGESITVTTGIAKMTEKKGKAPHKILGEGNVIYTTFSDSIATMAQSALEAGLKVNIQHQGDQYNTIETLDLVED